MKISYIICLFLFGSLLREPEVTAQARARFTLRVRADSLGNHRLVLSYRDDKRRVVDSDAVKEGAWRVFKGQLHGPLVAQLQVSDKRLCVNWRDDDLMPPPALELVLDGGVTTVRGDARRLYMADVQGGGNDAWRPLKRKEQASTDAEWSYLRRALAAAKKGDSALFRQQEPGQEQRYLEILRLRQAFVRQHPQLFLSVYFVSELEHTLSLAEVRQLYDALAPGSKASGLGKQLGEKFEAMEATAAGRPALPLRKKDVDGKMVTLASLRGKYVLLDFWGSWCGFCRISHPHLRKMYSRYRDKGFEIIGIAYEQKKTLEENYAAMKQAIREDSIPWIQVLNNDGIDSFDVVKSYGIDGFPTKILLDREGKIIGRYVGSENPDLDSTMTALLGDRPDSHIATLRVQLSHLDGAKPVLIIDTGTGMKFDTAARRDGDWMIFTDTIRRPAIATLLVRKKGLNIELEDGSFIPGPALQVLLEPGETIVRGDADAVYMASVSGGENDSWAPIKEKGAAATHASWTRTKAAYAAAAKGDSTLLHTDDRADEAAQAEMLLLEKNYIRTHPDAYLSLYFLSAMQSELAFGELDSLYEGLGNRYKSAAMARSLEQRITALRVTASGQPAIAIDKKDLDGRQLDLAALKGRYVLLDFWGSWCGPCRASHPHLMELYGKYKNKGLEIIGIASEGRPQLEQGYKALRAAIEEDHITWPQVLNDDGKDRFDAVQTYGIAAFPTRILLGKDGRIIARFVGSEHDALDDKLRELMGR